MSIVNPKLIERLITFFEEEEDLVVKIDYAVLRVDVGSSTREIKKAMRILVERGLIIPLNNKWTEFCNLTDYKMPTWMKILNCDE